MRIRLSDHFTYGKLLRFTLPSIAMMILTSIYGVVDGYFVSNFAGKTPFAAVNLIMPVLMIMGTVSFMFGSGGTALVAKTCGEGDKDRANRYFSLIVYIAFAAGVILAIMGFVLIRPIAARLGAEGPLLDSCVRYARIVLIALPLFSMQVMFQSFFVAAEKPKLSFTVSVILGVSNIVNSGKTACRFILWKDNAYFTKMKQEALSEELNISTDQLRKIECGSRGPSLDLLIALAVFLMSAQIIC